MEALRGLQHFRASKGHELLEIDFEDARDVISDTIAETTMTSIADFATQERLKGEYAQIKVILVWVDSRIEEITKILEHEEDTKK